MRLQSGRCGVLRALGGVLVTGRVGPPAEDGPPTNALVFITVQPRPQAPPQGSSRQARFPRRNQDFGCHFLALRSANFDCSFHCRDVDFVRSFPARAFARRCFAGGGHTSPILRRLSLASCAFRPSIVSRVRARPSFLCSKEYREASDRRSPALNVFNLSWEPGGDFHTPTCICAPSSQV